MEDVISEEKESLSEKSSSDSLARGSRYAKTPPKKKQKI